MSYERAADAEGKMRQRGKDFGSELAKAVGEREERLNPSTTDLYGRPREAVAAPAMKMGRELEPVTAERMDPRANHRPQGRDVGGLVNLFEGMY